MNGIPALTNGSLAAARGQAGGLAGNPAGHVGREAVAAAWERFAAGSDTVQGVRPEILISWYRCRDEYKVDPGLAQAPTATEEDHHRLEHDVVFATLGGLAARAAGEAEALGGVITVADSAGRLLATWGDPGLLRRAEASNLAPWAAWAEWASGTNGMGTALGSHRAVLVQGPEHWCQGFHEWSCAGIAVRDVVTDEPLAVLNVSCHQNEIPEATGEWLRRAAAGIRQLLARRARHSGDQLVAAFTEAAARASSPVAALDVTGKVVAANESAGPLLGVPAHVPAADPARRWVSYVAGLGSLAAQSAVQARKDPGWIGSTHLFLPFIGNALPVTVHPVFQAGALIGLLLTTGQPAGGQLPPAAEPPRRRILPDRIPGRRGSRLILLALPEVRFAEADGSTVWLASDQGRLQAVTQGLDNLERELAGEGFFRVHRRYLVNLRRVREVETGFKGGLFLITDARTHETVPVSRRHGPQLRRALGI